MSLCQLSSGGQNDWILLLLFACRDSDKWDLETALCDCSFVLSIPLGFFILSYRMLLVYVVLDRKFSFRLRRKQILPFFNMDRALFLPPAENPQHSPSSRLVTCPKLFECFRALIDYFVKHLIFVWSQNFPGFCMFQFFVWRHDVSSSL